MVSATATVAGEKNQHKEVPRQEIEGEVQTESAMLGEKEAAEKQVALEVATPETHPEDKMTHLEKESRPSLATMFLLKHPSACCGAIFILIVVCMVLMTQTVEMTKFDQRQYYVWDDIRVEREDAIFLAKDELTTANYGDSEVPLRIDAQNRWQTFIMYKSMNGDKILTPEHLKTISAIESKIMESKRYPRLCQAVSSKDSSCRPYDTMLPYFEDANTQEEIDNTLETLVETKYDKIKLVFETQFTPEHLESRWARSIFRFATPIDDGEKRYRSSEDDFDAQREYLVDFVIEVHDIAMDLQGSDLEVYLFSLPWWNHRFEELMMDDFKYVVLSIVFVVFYIAVHTKSLFVPFVAFFGILSSFPIAYTVYRFVMLVKLFNMLSLLSVFVILGIAADNIFVFVDAWNQSGEIPLLKGKFDARFHYVYRRASKAMFVTTLTTFCAFLATSISEIAPIAAFGLFSANLVMSNYFLVISYFPLCIMFREKVVYPWLAKRRGEKTPSDGDAEIIVSQTTKDPSVSAKGNDVENGENEESETETKAQNHQVYVPPTEQEEKKETEDQKMSPIEKFFATQFTAFVYKARWVFVILFVSWVPIGLYLATELPPLSEFERWFPDDHEVEIGIRKHLDGFHQGEEDGKITIEITYGLEGVDRSDIAIDDRYNPEERGELEWEKEFDLSLPDNQRRFIEICDILDDSPLVRNSFVKCFLKDLRDWRLSNGEEFPIDSSEFTSVLRTFMDTTVVGDDHSTKKRIGLFGDELKFAIIRAVSEGDYGAYDDMHPLWTDWEDWMDETNEGSKPGLNKGFQSSRSWQLMITERALLRNAFGGMAIAGAISLIVLLISSGNCYVAFFAIFSIIGIVSSVFGLVYALEWEFGMVVSIAVVILIGFSVDYTVHISHAYVESIQETRLEKTRETLRKMGVSIFGGAVTTFGTGAVLFLTTVVFFFKFAWVITSTILFSLLWSTLFLPSILMICGPEGESGDIKAMYRNARAKFQKSQHKQLAVH